MMFRLIRRFGFSCLLGLLALGFVACEGRAEPPMPALWQLTFSDEFNNGPLDTTKWNTTYPYNRRTTPSNSEWQWYVDDAFDFQNGMIRLRADKKTVDTYNYTSGMIASWGKFSQRYGYFEARLRIPKGRGLWPAFWLLPASTGWPPELDIMENLGHRPDKIFMTNHYIGLNGAHLMAGSYYIGPDYSADFHTFAADWRPGLIVWYIDGIERFRSTSGVPTIPMYVLANLAVGGSWPGYPDATTPFPSWLDIDYIRIYQLKTLL
jgi:beta-glucanase (GH16 family)